MPRTYWDEIFPRAFLKKRSGLSNGYPTQNMLFAPDPPVLKKNKVHGSYKDAEEYLTIHTNLLLEDFMYPLREALKQFNHNIHRNDFNGVRVYRYVNLTLSGADRLRKRNYTYVLSGIKPLSIFSRGGEAEPSFGRLLLFTQSNFKEDLIMGKSDKTGKIKIELQIGTPYSNGKYIMMQADALYYKYEHILRVLDSLNEDNFPMKEYIVYGSKTDQYPGYFRASTEYNVFGQKVPVISRWELDNESIKMNKSQLCALEEALTTKLAVVQGPPGTGKTYFGVLMVKVLLDNVRVWNPTGRTPLLVVCQSNKGLDNFLEGLLKYTGDIVRVGDQSQSKALEPFTLNALLSAQLAQYPKDKFLPRGYSKAITKEILATAYVVGMTTTGASSRRDQLIEMESPIVIVDEAAEVLEADVIASMTEYCQHLILLGDHKQLKPITTTHHLAVDYNLNTSLFERLIRNQTVQVFCLTTQYRMRPEISSLLKPHIYTQLDDAPSTLNRPPVRGILKSVFFLHHEETEETVNGAHGFFNSHEARMLIALANYLVSVGYCSSQITVIVMYEQQRSKLEGERAKYLTLQHLEIASVDSFQGRENDIILLSLVRNNATGNIGFLREKTRACVALSRARQGLFIMGNKNCLEKAGPTVWSDVMQCLSKQDAIGTKLPLVCRKHDVTLEVINPLCLNDSFCLRCCQDRQEEYLTNRLVERHPEHLLQEQKMKSAETQKDLLKNFDRLSLREDSKPPHSRNLCIPSISTVAHPSSIVASPSYMPLNSGLKHRLISEDEISCTVI